MAVEGRELGAGAGRATRSIGRCPAGDRLPVDGELPRALHGSFLQAISHPAACLPAGRQQADIGPRILTGVRIDDGVARWFRAGPPPQPGHPLGPVPALAPSVWLAEPGRPAGTGTAPITMARPVRETGSPRWHTVVCHPGLGYAEYLVVAPGGEVLRATPFALDGAPLMHAMALTRRFVVVFDLPVCYLDAAALVGARFPYSWRPRRPARVGLIPRWGGDAAEPRWFAIDPCYIFQSANAYDDHDRVVLDATAYPRAFDSAMEFAHEPAGPPRLCRWVFDLRSGTVRTRPLLAFTPAGREPGPEVAVVDDRVRGRRHRYLFGTAGDPRIGAVLVRLDLPAGAVASWRFGPGLVPGEPVFVPAADFRAEGAGWLIVAVEDPARRRSDLMVFDALDVAAPPLATVRLPVSLPVAGRTTWFDDGRDRKQLRCPADFRKMAVPALSRGTSRDEP